jgi:chorismate mutase/prephenate dehydratase
MAWDYVFFIDLEGHVEDKPLERALAELSRAVGMPKVLGSYPKGIL